MPPRRRVLKEVDKNATPVVRPSDTTANAKSSFTGKQEADQLQAALVKREEENDALKAQVAALTDQLSKAKIEPGPETAATAQFNPFDVSLPFYSSASATVLPPKRPTNAFQYFSQEHRDGVKAAMQGAKAADINAELRKLWDALSERDAARYHASAAADSSRFEAEKAEYEMKKGAEERKAKAVHEMRNKVKMEAALKFYDENITKVAAKVKPESTPAPQKPKHARSAWIFYQMHRRTQLRGKHDPTGEPVPFAALAAEIGEEWTTLQGSRKKADKNLVIKMKRLAEEDKERFDRELLEFYEKKAEWSRKQQEVVAEFEKMALENYDQKEKNENMILQGKKALADEKKALDMVKRQARHEKRAAKELKASQPKAARTAYQFFMMENRVKVQAELGEERKKEVMSVLGQQWKGLTEEKKLPYDQMAADDRLRLQTEMAALPQ